MHVCLPRIPQLEHIWRCWKDMSPGGMGGGFSTPDTFLPSSPLVLSLDTLITSLPRRHQGEHWARLLREGQAREPQKNVADCNSCKESDKFICDASLSFFFFPMDIYYTLIFTLGSVQSAENPQGKFGLAQSFQSPYSVGS